MDESAALDTTAARAVETADRDRVLWSDADREWASRVAAAIVGERASAGEGLGRRAQFVLKRIGTRRVESGRVRLADRAAAGAALRRGRSGAGVADPHRGGGLLDALYPGALDADRRAAKTMN